jgi:hypothetical protein
MAKPFTVNQVEFKSIRAAADHFKVPYRTVQSRLKRGATIEEALGVSGLNSRTCTWCQREWPLSNFAGRSQCRGCQHLQRVCGLSVDEVQAWVMHQGGPRCAMCKEGYAENGGPLAWGCAYQGEETDGYRLPLCIECTQVLELSHERFGHQVGQAAKKPPQAIVARLVAQNHVCPACSKALAPADTVFVDPALIHRKCRLSVQ